MQIIWKDENQGGGVESKDILIIHSEFYSETTTINKLRAEKERLNKLIEDLQEKLENTTGKLNAAITELSI
jgi:hypothetical protein